MTNQSTIDKLIEMRLTTMADAFRNRLDNPKLNKIAARWPAKAMAQFFFTL